MAKYVTKEDYLQTFNEDLNLILGANWNCSDVGNPASSFLSEIEDLCILELSTKYDFSGNPSTEHQLMCLKKGILYQAKYVLQEGDIHNNSGLNAETGAFIPSDVMERIGMSRTAMKWFLNGGMANVRSV